MTPVRPLPPLPAHKAMSDKQSVLPAYLFPHNMTFRLSTHISLVRRNQRERERERVGGRERRERESREREREREERERERERETRERERARERDKRESEGGRERAGQPQHATDARRWEGPTVHCKDGARATVLPLVSLQQAPCVSEAVSVMIIMMTLQGHMRVAHLSLAEATLGRVKVTMLCCTCPSMFPKQLLS